MSIWFPFIDWMELFISPRWRSFRSGYNLWTKWTSYKWVRRQLSIWKCMEYEEYGVYGQCYWWANRKQGRSPLQLSTTCISTVHQYYYYFLCGNDNNKTITVGSGRCDLRLATEVETVLVVWTLKLGWFMYVYDMTIMHLFIFVDPWNKNG